MNTNYKLLRVILLAFVFLTVMLKSTFASISVETRKIQRKVDVSKDHEITLKKAIDIAKQHLVQNHLSKKYKLSSASIYKRLTDHENIGVAFRSGFFNISRPFPHIVVVDRLTGEVKFSGEIK